MSVGSVLLCILNFNIARFLNIQIVTFFVNKSRSESTQIGQKQKFVMWVAGLRGAMAYALAINSIDDYGEPGKIMLSITLIYALITILGVGSFLNPVLNYGEVTRKEGISAEPEEIESGVEKKRCCQGFKKCVADFDQRYFSPVFTMQSSKEP